MTFVRWLSVWFLGCTAAWASARTLVVAADGSGDFKTVQEAVAAAPQNSAEQILIHLKAGTYQGPVVVPRNKPHLTFQGEGADQTILTYDRNVYDPIPPGIDKFNPGLQVFGR